jgi:acetyl-CoA carboxylase biotin carboxyl carrier protein
MTHIDQDDVIEILKILEESSFDELHLEKGDLKLFLNKRREMTSSIQDSGLSPEEPTKFAVVQDPARKARAHNTETATSITSESSIQKSEHIIPLEEKGIPIKAPVLGTFYRAPKPGAPPFVEVGQIVNEHDTVCIIEVMKCFTTVKAGVQGRIVKIYAENGQMVEYNQTLFLVVEATDAENPEEKHP